MRRDYFDIAFDGHRRISCLPWRRRLAGSALVRPLEQRDRGLRIQGFLGRLGRLVVVSVQAAAPNFSSPYTFPAAPRSARSVCSPIKLLSAKSAYAGRRWRVGFHHAGRTQRGCQSMCVAFRQIAHEADTEPQSFLGIARLDLVLVRCREAVSDLPSSGWRGPRMEEGASSSSTVGGTNASIPSVP